MPLIQDSTISQQIEAAADYYPPATYSGSFGLAEGLISSYLTYYNDLTLAADPLAFQYYPISSVAQRSRNPKIFAVGVLAPSARISGLLLDRSASIKSALPADPQYASVQTPSGTVEIVNRQVSTSPRQQVPDKLTPLSSAQAKQALYEAFIKVTGQAPSDQVLALLTAQSALETGRWSSIHNYNFGNVKGTNWPHQTTTYPAGEVVNGKEVLFPAGVPETNFRAYNTASEGAADYILILLRDNPRRNPPDAWKQALLTGEPEALAVALRTPPPYYTADVRKYAAGMTKLYNEFLGLNSPARDAYDGNWKKNGSDAAAAAKKIEDKTSNTDLKADKIAQLYTDAQRAQILDLQKTQDAMANAPPMKMLVNPASFSVKGEQIVADSNWSRNGRSIIEHWGQGQDKISASGKVAGFYAADILNAVGPGLTRMARNYSQSWQNFQSLCLFYKNNGGMYSKDLSSDGERNLSLVGSIYLYYDNILYIGSFDNLSVSEADTAPHTVDYSFEFTVRAAFLLDNPNSNQNTPGVTQPSSDKPATSYLK